MNKIILKFIGFSLVAYGGIDLILWQAWEINATPFLPEVFSVFSPIILILLGGFFVRKGRGE